MMEINIKEVEEVLANGSNSQMPRMLGTVEEKPLKILLVEDLIGDTILTKNTLDITDVPYSLTIIRKGEQVVPYLEENLIFKPDLLLLDIGMPGMDGFDILEQLSQKDFSISTVPIVILTSLENFEHICKCYPRLHIISYLNKPCAQDGMKTVMQQALQERKDFKA